MTAQQSGDTSTWVCLFKKLIRRDFNRLDSFKIGIEQNTEFEGDLNTYGGFPQGDVDVSSEYDEAMLTPIGDGRLSICAC